ncbi:hypothetical protein [Alloscardovia macacae]|uniref:Uncharacterized protein n=1 Tax=Alloscardovia macacae TaxID=1160091 RepID=A0A261F6M4_9BIFI|nr:hypothetical protein [Alloscardovia macacae]OZG54782.1 hypothetical protein ALMA_0107 [Alloscardovia macacae]
MAMPPGSIAPAPAPAPPAYTPAEPYASAQQYGQYAPSAPSAQEDAWQPPRRTHLYALALGFLAVGLGAYLPFASLACVAGFSFLASMRGSRVLTRRRGSSTLALTLALPWHALKAAATALSSTLGAALVLLLVNAACVLALRFGGFSVEFGNYSSTFALINAVGTLLGWYLFVAHHQAQSLYEGLHAPLEVSRTAKICLFGMWSLAALGVLLEIATSSSVQWAPLPDIQAAFFTGELTEILRA